MSTLRLSEAMLMGRHLVKPQAAPYEWDEIAGRGCALTMAGKAIGGETQNDAMDRWPWAREHYWDITGKFDLEVMAGTMTLEQLADYVKSLEPAEDPQLTEEEAATCWPEEEFSDVRPELEVHRGRL